jgi:Domain of unknown function (DUF4439)
VSGTDPTAALQAALQAVDAAIYGYGVAGARLPGAQRSTAQRAWATLQQDRDTLQSLLASRGHQPAAAAAAYRLPFPVHTTQAALSLAGYLEEQLAAAYLGLVALEEPPLRAWGAQQVRSCAIRAAGWLGRTSAFPGLVTPAAAPGPARPASAAAG